MLESWSGYEKADHVKSVFGEGNEALLAENSPLLTLPRVAPLLRREHAFVWFYSGDKDGLREQNARFAAELRRLHVPYGFFLTPGGHTGRCGGTMPGRRSRSPRSTCVARALRNLGLTLGGLLVPRGRDGVALPRAAAGWVAAARGARRAPARRAREQGARLAPGLRRRLGSGRPFCSGCSAARPDWSG